MHVRTLRFALAALLATAAVATAAPQHATLDVSDNGSVSWVDATQSRQAGTPRERMALICALTDEAFVERPATQTAMAILNAAARHGWSVAAVERTTDGHEYLLRSEAADAARWPPASAAASTRPAAAADRRETHVDVTITGGHDTDPRDNGRPVALVAGALGVTPEQFRDAFSRVTPARGEGGPTAEQAQANKRALLERLGPLGVSNDRLDEVSNRYRYRRDRGETWPQRPAAAYATVSDGRVTGVTVTDGGGGYTSPPTLTIASMPGVRLVATLGFDADFAKNGRVASVTVAPPAK